MFEATSAHRMFTPAVEDYVKAVYKLQSGSETVSTNDLAKKMGSNAAAASKMIKHMASLGLVTHAKYYGVRLTQTGERVAIEIIRHHRLIELYLVTALGYSWDQVDAEAERLEHFISEDFEAKIDALLGYPERCPHGDPIPSADWTLNEKWLTTLAECEPGQTVEIVRVRDTDSAVLRELSIRGISLGTRMRIAGRDSFGEITTLEVGDETQVVGPHLARSIFVERRPEPAAAIDAYSSDAASEGKK